jgi:hypothetical protein
MLEQINKEEGVRVFISDVVNEGDMPQFGLWASPSFEDCVCQYCDLGGCDTVEIDLFVIIHCRVAGFDHLNSTKEGAADKGWDNVDTARRFPQIVVQLGDCGCCCCGSIWQMKHSHRHSAG